MLGSLRFVPRSKDLGTFSWAAVEGQTGRYRRLQASRQAIYAGWMHGSRILYIAQANYRLNFRPFGIRRRDRRSHMYVIGKTGTAQVISFAGREAAGDTDRDLRAHGWCVFAAPAGAPEIAGVVFGEPAEPGSWTAPIAKHGMDCPVYPSSATSAKPVVHYGAPRHHH